MSPTVVVIVIKMMSPPRNTCLSFDSYGIPHSGSHNPTWWQHLCPFPNSPLSFLETCTCGNNPEAHAPHTISTRASADLNVTHVWTKKKTGSSREGGKVHDGLVWRASSTSAGMAPAPQQWHTEATLSCKWHGTHNACHPRHLKSLSSKACPHSRHIKRCFGTAPPTTHSVSAGI